MLAPSTGPHPPPDAALAHGLVSHARVQPITRALAELQTTILAAGLRAFDGWLDRFAAYTLIVRLSGTTDPRALTPISVHALAGSLGRPYETVRRHVQALIAVGLVARVDGRVIAVRDALDSPPIAPLLHTTHDAFVRFVEHLAAAGEPLPPPRTPAYDWHAGVQAAADIMLAITQTNRNTHDGWLALILFSTVLAANCRGEPLGPLPHPACQPVGAAPVARALDLSNATASRHLAAMVESGQLERRPDGYVVRRAWLDDPAAQAVTQRSLQNVRRLLGVLAARGFPFDDPARAYLGPRPPLTPIV